MFWYSRGLMLLAERGCWSGSAPELRGAGNVPAQHREQVTHTAWGHAAALGSKTWPQELCAIPNLHRHCRKTLSGSHMSVDTLPHRQIPRNQLGKGLWGPAPFLAQNTSFYQRGNSSSSMSGSHTEGEPCTQSRAHCCSMGQKA